MHLAETKVKLNILYIYIQELWNKICKCYYYYVTIFCMHAHRDILFMPLTINFFLIFREFYYLNPLKSLILYHLYDPFFNCPKNVQKKSTTKCTIKV